MSSSVHRAPPPSEAPLPCTGARVRRLTRRMTSFYELHMRPTGLKLSQYSVLKHLSAEPQTLTQLADRLEMDRTTATRALRPLVDAGWVAAVAGEDARQRLFVLTGKGSAFRDRAEASWREAQLALEAQLGRAFVGELNALLERTLERLKPALPEDN
jgi:DNA-binding MarR family transcriptional regulator